MFGIERNIKESIKRDIERKFVFLSGPRQVGKTTLAKKIILEEKGRYLLYDDENDRATILRKEYIHEKWVCLDEFHKYDRWKNHIKGVYDKYHDNLRLILSGSARLDVFQKSGDSLFGRYYLHHLHPLTVGELAGNNIKLILNDIHSNNSKSEHIHDLLRFGGFPEPFTLQSEKEHRRWSNARRTLLIQEEMRELTEIKLLSLIEHLMLLLPDRIGSQFSYNSLAEEIKVSVPTIQNWMEIFQRLFIVFKVMPYSNRISRSILKQPKYYFWDWSQIRDQGIRFENFIASHLFKASQIWTDLGEADVTLYYVRDRDKREVDFLLVKNNEPWFLVESKLSDTKISPSLEYFCNRLNVPGVQLVLQDNINKRVGDISVISADTWLMNLL